MNKEPKFKLNDKLYRVFEYCTGLEVCEAYAQAAKEELRYIAEPKSNKEDT